MSRSRPLVSVVTPAFRAMPYLEETLISVQSQDYPNIEHIVMDGGSRDGTVETLQKYPQVRWRSEPDKGQSDALNKGFREARGDIIGWLNADDLYEPKAVSRAVEVLESDPAIDLVHSDLKIIGAKSDFIGITKSRPFTLATHLTNNYIKQPTIFMRRKVLDQLGGVDPAYHYVMDREFWLRVGLAEFKWRYLPGEYLAAFRLCEGTKTFSQTVKFREEWHSVLQKAAQGRHGAISRREINRALRETAFGLQMARHSERIAAKDRVGQAAYYFKALQACPKKLFMPSVHLAFAMGLLGIEQSKFRRFKTAQA